MITIGVSACLLGSHVRYDGAYKYDRIVANVIGLSAQFVPICPEVGCGLTVPRAPMELVGEPESPRLVICGGGEDLTERLLAYCRQAVNELAAERISGFIFKERSPSCALTAAVLVTAAQVPSFTAGLFAREVVRRFPTLPVVEAEQLQDDRLREEFMERVKCHTLT